MGLSFLKIKHLGRQWISFQTEIIGMFPFLTLRPSLPNPNRNKQLILELKEIVKEYGER